MRLTMPAILLAAILLTSGGILSAQGPLTEECKTAWSDAWSYANALAVMDDFQRLYVPHTSALLQGEQQLSHGLFGSSLQSDLETLPGVRGWIWGSLKDFQSSDSSLKEDVVMEFLMNRKEASAKKYESPMMQRKVVSEHVHFIRMRFPNESYDLMVHYIAGKPPLPPRGFIALILDREWLVRRIPSEMDSLARESLQLLFWAPWAKNTFVEQSLGIITGADTLWWGGVKTLRSPTYKLFGRFPTSRFTRSCANYETTNREFTRSDRKARDVVSRYFCVIDFSRRPHGAAPTS